MIDGKRLVAHEGQRLSMLGYCADQLFDQSQEPRRVGERRRVEMETEGLSLVDPVTGTLNALERRMSDGHFSPFALLYGEARKLPGVGYVTCSKPISAKFPALTPIRDGRVEKLLELQKDRHWWNPMRKLLQSGRVRGLLSEITLARGAPNITTLCRLDVALVTPAVTRVPVLARMRRRVQVKEAYSTALHIVRAA